MRKSLLITSALGFAAVLPALAMAGSAAGSTAAACGSGFFAQFDAKVMNAKLQLKNADAKADEQSDATVEADLIAAQEKALADMSLIADGFTDAQITKFRNTVGRGGFNLRAYMKQGTEIRRKIYLLQALRGDADADLTGLFGGGPVPDEARLNAVTLADVEGLLTALDAAVVGPLTAVGGGQIDPDANIAKTKFNKLYSQIEEIRSSIEADATAAAEFKAVAGNTNLEDILNGTFLGNAAFSNQLVGGNAIVFGNLPGTNLGKRKVFAFAGTDAAFKGAGFDLTKTTFIGGVAKKNARAAALKAQDWFSSTVQEAKGRIADQNALAKKNNENLDRLVHHHALAGGVGATVGWWQNLGGFALSLSGSGDYHWGTFRTVDDKSGETVKVADKRRLGFGFQGDVGAHYVVSPSTTLGVLVGLRGQQLQFGRTDTTSNTDSKDDYASKWVLNPAVSVQARTFFTDNVYGALTVGYIIPMSEKDYGLDNTRINQDAKIRFQGLTGAFSVGMVF